MKIIRISFKPLQKREEENWLTGDVSNFADPNDDSSSEIFERF